MGSLTCALQFRFVILFHLNYCLLSLILLQVVVIGQIFYENCKTFKKLLVCSFFSAHWDRNTVEIQAKTSKADGIPIISIETGSQINQDTKVLKFLPTQQE